MPFNQLQNYDMQTLNYSTSQWVTVPRNCNGFMVTNVGDTIFTINDLICYPGVPGTNLGDSRSFGGNAGEIYKGTCKLSFATPAGAAPNAEIVFKVYIP